MTRTAKHTVVPYLAKFSFLAFLIAGFYFYTLSKPVSSVTEYRSFEIVKGQSVRSVASSLKSAGLIKSPLYFRYIVRQKNLTIQAGIFQISTSSALREIANTLTKGVTPDVKLTIPEGFRSEQIAETAGIPIKEFLVAAKGLEGQLFPDTYFIKKGITAPEIVAIMHDNFIKKTGTVDKSTLILASLVERETKGDSEKPIVAGILKKRLATGWALELDATVQYFLGKPGNWWANTTLLDRKIASPYNTYLHTGLPPSPIGNPGLSSIKAVQNAVDSPYWFYLHDREGNIRYGSTLEEHNQNIARYIRS